MLGTKPYFPKESQREIKWYLVDADGKILGRLATQIANLLRGKHHPTFTPHADGGFRVAVVNTENIQVTGNKAEQKFYFRHSGYPGGLTEHSLEEVRQIAPTRVIQHAVKGMLPKSKLGRKMLSRLKLYVGNDHPHQAQIASATK